MYTLVACRPLARGIYVLLLLVMLLHTSCVGLVFVAGTRRDPQGNTIGTAIGDDGGTKGGRTKADALRLWGMPNRKFIRNGYEYWVYKKHLTWRGVVVWAVLFPLPLLMPVGRHQYRLQFQADSLTGFTTSYAREFAFGLFYGDSRGFEFVFGRQTNVDGW